MLLSFYTNMEKIIRFRVKIGCYWHY